MRSHAGGRQPLACRTMHASPITVLHVDSAREYRGGQNQVRLLMKGLSGEGGVRQALVARSGSRLSREARALGIDVRPVPWGPAIDPRALAVLRREFDSAWTVVHAHDGHAVQSVLLARAIAGGRAPVAASRRVDFPPRRAGVWQRADLIIAVSRRIRDVLLERGIDRRRVEVVYSGIDPEDLEAPGGPTESPTLRVASGAGPAEMLVASVGALVEHKDHATFVRAAARLAAGHPAVRFAVFGEGPERARLEQLIRRLELDGRFRLPGEIPNAARRLREVDVFVMPSREEGLGTACIEAMLAGRPVAATSAGGLGELAASGAFRPVPPGDPDALAVEIERLLASEVARHEASEAARRGGSRFTAARMVEGTLRCYRALSGSDG